MILQFSHEERAYIVDNRETDLLLTDVGLRLVDRYTESNGNALVDVPQSEYEQFIIDLKDEFVWKSQRLIDPRVLINLARRFLQDFDSLEPVNVC